jgi:hypothetical protein
VRNVLVALFWLWVIGALGIYAYRIWRRFARGPAPKDAEPAGSDRPAPLEPSLAPAPPTAAPVERGPTEVGLSTIDRSSDTAGRRPSVAEALTGITMPCDLMPATGSASMDPYRVAFITDGRTATEVGAAVGDELRKLGFEVRSTTPDELLATKDGAQVTVSVHADATIVTVAGTPAFPNARPDSVVVEFRT